MTENPQVILLAVRGVIASLPSEDQEKVKKAYADIKAIVEQAGDAGKVAVAWLGAELSA